MNYHAGISQYVGRQIRRIRKSRGLTMDELGYRISKSRATLSKYESGAIKLDIETLFDIAQALEVDVKTLIDYRPAPVEKDVLPKGFFFSKPQLYVYYYDGRTNEMILSILRFTAAADTDPEADCSAVMYFNVDNHARPDKYLYLLNGFAISYDTTTYVILSNQINPAERMQICILNPLHANTPAVGMVCGIGTNPFFAPIAIKAVFSNDLLEENEALKSTLQFSREDVRLYRYYNMMVVNRPNTMFLDIKK